LTGCPPAFLQSDYCCFSANRLTSYITNCRKKKRNSYPFFAEIQTFEKSCRQIIGVGTIAANAVTVFVSIVTVPSGKPLGNS
jgi:hypothetical protein